MTQRDVSFPILSRMCVCARVCVWRGGFVPPHIWISWLDCVRAEVCYRCGRMACMVCLIAVRVPPSREMDGCLQCFQTTVRNIMVFMINRHEACLVLTHRPEMNLETLFLQALCFGASASVQLELLSVFLCGGDRWESSCISLGIWLFVN